MTPQDDPKLDGTPDAHPAWHRGVGLIARCALHTLQFGDTHPDTPVAGDVAALVTLLQQQKALLVQKDAEIAHLRALRLRQGQIPK